MKRDKLWLYAWDWVLYISIHLEKEMATHSSVVAWRIPGTGEPGGLPSMGSHRVGHDWSNLAAAAAAYSSHNLLLTLMQIIYVFMCINTHTHIYILYVSDIDADNICVYVYKHTHTHIYIYILYVQTRILSNFRGWWSKGRPGVLQSMGSQSDTTERLN